MEIVCKYNECAGCMACVDICPKGTITIKDDMYAYNAVIDSEKCVGCNACHRVCQQNHPAKGLEPIEWMQGWAHDAELRKECSSGGVATAISKAFVEKSGVVCSCVFREGQFIFEFAESVKDVEKFIGSKYVKSNPLGIYREIRRRLRDGDKILFIGLPCQVSSLKNYVGENCDNLYTVDLICHGTPSPKVLSMFLKQYGMELNDLRNIKFRQKAKFQLYGDEKSVVTKGVSDRYSIAFLNSLIYTENCYTCPYAKQERVSDLTLGDSWGSELSENELREGVSLLLVQNKKGKELINMADLCLFPVNKELAIANNHQLSHPSIAPKKRTEFFERITEKRFNAMVSEQFPKQCLRQDIKRILINAKIYRGGVIREYQPSNGSDALAYCGISHVERYDLSSCTLCA